DIVEVLGVHGDWYHIMMNKVSGYIHSDYVVKVDVDDEVDEDLPPPVVPTFNLVGKVTGAVLNVRAAATTDSAVINQLTLGQKVEVLSLEGNWAKVKLASGTGYVYKT